MLPQECVIRFAEREGFKVSGDVHTDPSKEKSIRIDMDKKLNSDTCGCTLRMINWKKHAETYGIAKKPYDYELKLSCSTSGREVSYRSRSFTGNDPEELFRKACSEIKTFHDSWLRFLKRWETRMAKSLGLWRWATYLIPIALMLVLKMSEERREA